MSSIETELWNIFTYYTLHANPKDPSKINGTILYKFCRDIMVLDASMTEKPITQAELHIIFTSELKQCKKVGSSERTDRIEYDGFLSCLMKIAIKCYPSSSTYEDAMQQLLMDNVLPLASRRSVVDVSALVHQPSVDTLFSYFEESMQLLFQYYATFSDQTTKSKTLMKSMGHLAGKSFEMQRTEFIEAKEKEQYQSTQASLMGYSEFLRFASDFGLVSSMGLTCLDLGDIYLVVLTLNKLDNMVRRLTFKEFWEALVRCAIVAFKSHTDITTEDKVKGMFLYIWRHIQSSVQEQVSKPGSILNSQSSQKVSLMRGSQVLNERFLNLWAKDGHRDYLSPPAEVVPDGASVIKNLVLSMNASAEDEESTEEVAGTPLVHAGSGESKRRPKQQYLVDIDVDVEHQVSRDAHGSHTYMEGSVFGDERITATKLKRLLQMRPDITKLLSDCIIEDEIEA